MGLEVRDSLRGRLLDPELLRTLVAVIECGGYTSAAHYLHRTQAAVSQQIRRLEEAAGAALFQSPKNPPRLTQQGAVMLDYARRLIALNQEALEQLQPNVVSGVVRMGATNYYATSVLPPLLTEFARRYPHIHIDLEVGVADVMQKKLGASLDLTINSFQSGCGHGVLLRKDPAVWVASRNMSPHENDPLPLALLPSGSLLRRWAEEALTRSGRRWVVVQESSTVDVLKASVLAGLAVGVFQKTTVKPFRSFRVLTPAQGFPSLPSSEMWLERADRELPRAAKCLHQFLLDQLPPWEASAPTG